MDINRRQFLKLLGIGSLAVVVPTILLSKLAPVALPIAIVAAPAFSFKNDPDTGIYRVDADTIGFAVAGKRIS